MNNTANIASNDIDIALNAANIAKNAADITGVCPTFEPGYILTIGNREALCRHSRDKNDGAN